MAREGSDRAADRVIGTLDIGTNAVRLLVARVHADASYSVVTQQREQVRLGEGGLATRMLTPDAIDRAVSVCTQFAALARSHGARRLIAAATSATREAANQGVLIARLEREAGVHVRVVSGREEARLIFQALRHRVGLGERPVACFDIGGGSTEIAVGDVARDRFLDSLKLGSLRLAADRFGLDNEAPITAEAYGDLKRSIEVTSVYAARAVRDFDVAAAYGTSGTIRTLAAVAARAVHADATSDETLLTLEDVRQAANLLRRLNLAERRRVPGMSPERADVIVAGAAILEALMEGCGIESLRTVVQCGVREGLLDEELEAREPGRPLHRKAVRERSVSRLARACGTDENHAAQVAALALQLFDSAACARLHRYGEAERELLEYAARLHDIGAIVAYNDHHLHSHYVVRHSDLLGFDQEEIVMIATITLLHRKAMSAARYPHDAVLGRRGSRLAVRLGVLLRIAELLDRGHAGAVATARLTRAAGGMRLEVVPAGDCRLELWGVENRRRPLEKGLGHTLEVVVLAPDGVPADYAEGWRRGD
jgi:exopolyphosphatase/guanosine-5'-triphosphate,3'-diphosphate pyrophosphatase